MGCPLSLGHRPEPIISAMDQCEYQEQDCGAGNNATTTNATASSSLSGTANHHHHHTTTTINYKAKLERKICWSKETPDPIFDLAGCNLKQVPNGVFIQCKVLLKTHLLLQDNRLTGFIGGGQLQDLCMITVLNIACNKFKKLPDEIQFLANLRDLNVSTNELKTLPNTISRLNHLERLNLSTNHLVSVAAVANCPSLRVLNLSNNPKLVTPCDELATCPNLDKIIYDSNTEGNDESMMDNDKSELALDASALLNCASAKVQGINFANRQILESLAQDTQELEWYQRLQDEKRRELLKQMQCEQVEVDEKIVSIQREKESKRKQLIYEMVEEEELYKNMLNNLLCLKDGPDPELLEQERVEQEKLLEKVSIYYKLPDFLFL